MKDTIQLSKDFEKRNNISIAIKLYSDGSGTVNEFWDDEQLTNFNDEEELHEFLKNINYKLDENGKCFSPVQKD